MRFRYALMIMMLTMSGAAASLAFDWQSTSDHCIILDSPADPLYRIILGYVPERNYGDYGKSDNLELAVDWEMAYFRNVAYSDVNVNLDLDTLILPDSTELGLPGQLVHLSLDSLWTWRYAPGTAFQLDLRPGIYSDMEDLSFEMFQAPVSCRFIRAFHPWFSAYAGLDFRPGFDLPLVPLAGAKYEINELLVFDGGWPQLELTYYADGDWSVYAGFRWDNVSYDMHEESDCDREMITVEDYRIYGGVSSRVTEEFQLIAETGSVFGRSVEFERQSSDLDRDVEVGSTLFLRFGFSGTF